MTAEVHCAMLIQWSELDQAFILTLPNWSARATGPVTHGDSYEVAAQRGREVLELLVEETLASGDDLSRPGILVSVA